MNLLFGFDVVGILMGVALSFTIQSCHVVQSTAQPVTLSSDVAIPFELVNRHIVLTVRVNNSRPLSFVLDTGDSVALIDLDLAKELGLNLKGEVKVHGVGAELSTALFVHDSSFTISGFDGFSQPVTLAMPLRNLAPRLGHDFDGIIGSEFIKQFVVEVDYEARLIKLHDKDKFTYSGPGESISVHLNAVGHPVIEAEVTPMASDPIKGKFVLDLGASDALALYSPFVAERHLIGPNLKTIRALGGAGAGGESTGQIGRASELKIGKFRISNPITLFSEDKTGNFAKTDLLGDIGMPIMSKFRIFLDYGHDRIILEPNSTFAEPFDRAFSGLSAQAEGQDYRTFRVKEVLENSPASEGGLQVNDIITAIDGKSASQLTLTKLFEMFERPVSYKLTVRRGEQTLQVTLKPRKLV
jgi:Aspartyl protease/PDZ domain